MNISKNGQMVTVDKASWRAVCYAICLLNRRISAVARALRAA